MILGIFTNGTDIVGVTHTTEEIFKMGLPRDYNIVSPLYTINNIWKRQITDIHQLNSFPKLFVTFTQQLLTSNPFLGASSLLLINLVAPLNLATLTLLVTIIICGSVYAQMIRS